MLVQALPVALSSAAVFCALALMSDRPRGAFVAQCVLAAAAALMFVVLVAKGPILGVEPRTLSAFAVGAIAAAVAGMLYHLYLGRFDDVWKARAVFTLVYLFTAALFGLVFVSLI